MVFLLLKTSYKNEMEQISKYVYNIENLNVWIQTQQEIVIYGAGEYAKRLVNYIVSLGEENKIKGIVVTKKGGESEYKGIKIYEASPFLKKVERCYVIIAASSAYWEEIAERIKTYGNPYLYMTEELYRDLGRKLDTRMHVQYQGMDFLLAGFSKCGTTALHKALLEIKEIYLSDKKESQFFLWHDKIENPQKELYEIFFDNIREGQLVGTIDPTFAEEGYAEQIYNIFGNKIKIIFLLRNPVNATFSKFKMLSRFGMPGLDNLYKNAGHYYKEMFDEYFEQSTKEGVFCFEYIHWIEEIWKYYPKEQTKIFFFEEMVKEPDRVINEILEFIGLSGKYKFEKLPLVNEGNFVMADVQGYELARRKWLLELERLLCRKENVQAIYKNKCEYIKVKKRYDNAEKIYNVRMTHEQRKKLERYFNSSVRRLEAEIGRDLSGLWF